MHQLGAVDDEAVDLNVVLQVQEHEFFRRDGEDVLCTIPMSYAQACLGGKLEVPTVEDPEVLEIPAGTPSGKVFVLRGKGVTRLGGRRGRGDQHVQVVVQVPKKLSDEEEELVRKLAAIQESAVDEASPFKKFWQNLTS